MVSLIFIFFYEAFHRALMRYKEYGVSELNDPERSGEDSNSKTLEKLP